MYLRETVILCPVPRKSPLLRKQALYYISTSGEGIPVFFLQTYVNFSSFPLQAGGTARPEPVPPPRKRLYPRPAIPDIVPDIYRLYDSGTLPDRRPQRQVPSTCHNPTNRRQRSLRKKLAENKRKPVVPCHRIRKPVSRRKGKSGSRTGRADRRPSDKSDRHSKPHTRGKGTGP